MPRAAGIAGRVRAFATVLAALVLPVPALANADAGPAPDYASAGDSGSDWALQGPAAPVHEADVFYIHPTTFISQEWNQRMDDAATRAWTIASVAQRQASAFAACCDIAMPFYRQASSRAFVARAGRGAQAYDLAYGDILAAFRYWLKLHPGRPFIVAGHSQGALLGLRLVKEQIAGTPLADRMIAAYLPGIGIPRGALPTDVAPCITPSQTRCLAAWNSFTPEADTSAWTQRSVADYGVPGRDPAILCINPITFDAARPAASFAEGKGMLPPASRNAPPAPMVAHGIAAKCEDGVLRVTTAPGVDARPLPNGALHMYDIGAFWGDISANAALRTRQWLKEHP